MSDDERLARALERLGGKAMVPFGWTRRTPRPADRELKPFVVKVARPETRPEALEWVRRVLVAREAPVVVRGDGPWEVLAATATEQRARALAQELGLKGPVEIRPRAPGDSSNEVDARWVLVELSQLEVQGLDPSVLPLARTLQVPVGPLLVPGVGFGTDTVQPDADGVVRAVPVLVAVEHEGRRVVVPSAPLALARRLFGGGALRWRDGVLSISGRVELPVDALGRMQVTFDAAESSGDRGSLKRQVPAWRLWLNLEDRLQGRTLRHHDNELEGRVVLLSEVQTEVMTPIGRMSEAALLGQSLAQLLHGTLLARPSPRFDAYLAVAFAFAGAFLAVGWSSLSRRPGWLAWVVALGLVGGLHALAARHLFLEQGRQVAMVAPILAASLTFLAALGYAARLERSLRELLLRTLGRALRPEVLGRVEDNLSLMRPERLTIAVLAADLEGFTALTAKGDPSRLVGALRLWLHELTAEVLEQGGHVDKYLGDAVIAFWGAPLRLATPARPACEAALKLRAQFEEAQEDLERRAGGPVRLHIGIDVGPAVVGEMGTEHRLSYSVLGEPIATAVRLGQAARASKVVIVVSARVAEQVGHLYELRELAPVTLPKRDQPLGVLELTGKKET